MNQKRRIFVLAGLMILTISNGVWGESSKVNAILKGIDDATTLESDGTVKITLTQQRKEEGVRTTEWIFYRRDADNSFLIIATAPEKEKGNGYLRVDDNTWMYRRNTRNFQHISRDESICGTNASAQDFENTKLLEIYKPVVDAAGKEKITETKLGSIPVYQFEVKAKIEDVNYPKRVYWVQKDNNLPLKIQNYSLSGTLMQTVYYLKYTPIEGKYLWVEAVFVDEFEKGNKTIVQFQNMTTKKIPDHILTKAYLENLSK